jgi:magnesium-transporting ATPase (P-type)
MSPKQRDDIDGGPEAAKLWRKVDEVLYHYENGVAQRTGGLQVLARSLPDDKLKLVRRYMKNDEIVGVTGDGTNDAPALRNANVGMAMGSGTQVARDAAHITILDDNFASIVNAVKWGRNVFDNIRKFLQFQLTVNIVALTLTFIMACLIDGDVTEELPLNAVMLLWVNLIMDSMGALALATEKPTDALLDRPPHGKERLLSISMIRMNLAQATFQLIVLFILSSDAQFVKDLCGMGDGCNMFGNKCCDPETDWDGKTCTIRQNTLVFNAFVFCQFWNEINCRKLKELNVFERFFDSMMFTGVLIFTFILQFIMVELGQDGVGTNGLTVEQWGLCIAIGLIALPTGFLARLIPIKYLEDRFGSGKDIGDDDEEEEDEEEEIDNVDDAEEKGTPLVQMGTDQ